MDNIYNVIRKEHGKRKNSLLRKDSKAEKHFAGLLNKAQIFYVKEKCCYDKNGNWCYIDFFIPLYNIAIEIDGKEHESKKRKEKDIKKENFLKQERNIYTIRYTNKECLDMESISVIEIVKKAGRNKHSESEIEYIRKSKDYELRNASKIANFNVYSKIFLYDKDKDVIYKFNDLYIAKHSTGVDYKYLISALENNSDIHASNLFIISKDEKEINKLVERYYEYLWNN